MTYEVNNVNEGAMNYEYMIIRDCRNYPDGGYWYYGADNDVTRASQIAREIGNGLVVKSTDVKPLFWGRW